MGARIECGVRLMRNRKDCDKKRGGADITHHRFWPALVTRNALGELPPQ